MAKRAAGIKSDTVKKSDAHWGYIEGYYWKLLTWSERGTLVDHLGRLGANAYLYAPKEDPLHRRDWRIPYGTHWQNDWEQFAARAAKAGVQAIPGMAPGLSFDYLDEDDYRILLMKLETFRDLGSVTLALLMDDIPPALPENCKGKFSTLGEAHGLLLTRLLEDLNRNGKTCRLWFCPTVYTDQFAQAAKPGKPGPASGAPGLASGSPGPAAKDPYLLDLARTIPPEVAVMWTGPGIISEKLPKAKLAPISKLFKCNLLIWDNLYANDYCPQKLFVGPYRGRPNALWQSTRGVLLNPTGMLQTDLFLLTLLAASRRGESAAAAWKAALLAHDVPKSFQQIARFFDFPFFQATAADLSAAKAKAYQKALYPMIWNWKSALHREWAPFLFMLDADLKAAQKGKAAPETAWVRKRYPPVLARLLLRQGR